MYFRPEEFALLSRGGRVPPPARPPAPPPTRPPRRPGHRGRLAQAITGWRAQTVRRGRVAPPLLDIHQYLELEFTIEELR